jgi:esterase
MRKGQAISPDESLEHLADAVELNELNLEVVLPVDKDIILHRMRFHYLDWGTSGKTPIVFLHGGGLSAHTWDIVCLAFRRHYHCLALDQRGHGDSEWSPEMEYSREAQTWDLECFVDELGLEKLILVGMSMGGLNSLAFAGKHSDRLHALVIVDVGPDLHVEGAKQINDFTRSTTELPTVEAFVERAKVFNPLRDPALLRRSLLHNLRQLPDGRWTWKYDQRHRATWDLENMITEHAVLWKDVPNINCPALVVRGEHSKVFFDEDAKKLVDALPDARWVRIANAGHTVQGDNPKDLITALRDFFDKRIST